MIVRRAMPVASEMAVAFIPEASCLRMRASSAAVHSMMVGLRGL